MKLPKLFGKKDDDLDDDDLDDEEFEDFEAVAAAADDEVDLDDDGLDADDTDDGLDADDAEDADADRDVADADVDDDGVDRDDVGEILVGGEDSLDDPFEDIDDDDDDDDDYDEDDEGSARRKAILFAALGFGVVLLSAVGGAGWWYFTDDTPAAPAASFANEPGRVELAMPAPSGSLNAVGAAPSLNAAGAAPGLNAAAAGAGTAEPDAGAGTAETGAGAEAPPTPIPGANGDTAAAASPAPPAPLPGDGGLNVLNTLNQRAADVGGGLVVPAVAPQALAVLPDVPSAADQSQALANAPVRALLEEKDGVGELPKVGPNNTTSWQVYARPSDPSITAPRIALLIEGIGLSREASLGAINKLPPEISMALSPYGRDLQDWVFRSRLAGHEVFMSLPMESEDFPVEDAGPLALDSRIQLAENRRRLETVMASAGGYVGLVTMMGSRFKKAEGQLRGVLGDINQRGLMFVVGGNRSRSDAEAIAQELQLVRAVSEMYIDEVPRIQQIRENLDKLESVAKDRGTVLAMARPYPVTIKSIQDWLQTLPDKEVALVPVSAIATRPQAPE